MTAIEQWVFKYTCYAFLSCFLQNVYLKKSDLGGVLILSWQGVHVEILFYLEVELDFKSRESWLH